jgi:uncharacterized integral membrane protein
VGGKVMSGWLGRYLLLFIFYIFIFTNRTIFLLNFFGCPFFIVFN